MQITLDRLPVRPAPFADESASGYLRRVATANGHKCTGDLLAAFGARPSSPVVWPEQRLPVKSVVALAAQTPNAPSQLDKHVLYYHARCCPQCLREHGYWREDWEKTLVPFCIEHRMPLLAQCTHCCSALSQSSVHFMQCECGADLRTQTVPAIAIDARVEATGRALLDRYGSEASLCAHGFAAELAQLSKGDLERLIVFLGAYSQFSDSSKPRKLSLKANPEIGLAILTGASIVLADWPNGLQHLLDNHQLQTLSSRSVKQRLGYLYTAMHKDFAQPEFVFLRKAFDQLLINTWPDLIDLKNQWIDPDLRRQQPYVAATTLAKQTGIRTHQLLSWIQSGRLVGTVRTLPSGKTQVAVRKGQEQIIQQLNNRLNLQGASIYIGLPEKRLRELLAHNVIFGQAPKAGAQWQIHCSELDRLMALLKAATSIYSNSTDYLSIDQILRFRWMEKLDFPLFLKSIMSGAIATAWLPKSTNKNVESLCVDVSSFNQWVEPFEGGFTLPDVCKKLSIKQQVGYHLINRNLLASREAGRRGCRISADALQHFQQHYIFARDLAKAQQTSSRALVDRLKRYGINPIAGPDIDGCRQVIYFRVDVCESSLVGYTGSNSLMPKEINPRAT